MKLLPVLHALRLLVRSRFQPNHVTSWRSILSPARFVTTSMRLLSLFNYATSFSPSFTSETLAIAFSLHILMTPSGFDAVDLPLTLLLWAWDRNS
jgi:hypothetical protein